LVEEFLKKEGHDDPEIAITELAQRLIKNAGMKPPIDPFELAEFYGIKVREIEGMSLDGRVIPLENSFIIEVSKEKPLKRKRFTIAHELIHIFLMKSVPLLPNNIPNKVGGFPRLVDKEIESLCDLGAGEILMPRYFFEPKLRQYGVSIDTLLRLSEEFQTSIRSTAKQIVRVDGCCAFVFWEFMAKPGAPEDFDFRVSWSITPKGIFIPRYDRAMSPNLRFYTVYEALMSDVGRSEKKEVKINRLGNLKGIYYVESIVIKNYKGNIPDVLSLILLSKK
jgi:Zn-dependent peptidase ImmA (M78 family)